MSESTPPAAAVPPAVPGGEGQADPAAQAQAWEAMLKGGMLPGTMPFTMPFGQPFMYPGFMLPGLMPGFGLPAEGEAGKTEGEGSGEDDDTEDEGGDDDDEESGSDKEGRPKRKRARSAAKKAKSGDGVVKSNSNAALAMLAGAAATKPGVPGAIPAAAAAAAMQQSLEGMWGQLNGGAAAGMPATASQLDISKLTPAEQQQLLSGEFPFPQGITDERELKRMRRKQSNRESARRSRLRKQAECEQLGRQVKELMTENSRLKEEKMQLVAQIEILNAKLSMSAFGAMHTLGGGGAGDLEKIQAEMRAKQTQDMQSMAAAMAQAMQVNGGAMLGAAGLGIPTLDPSALEGKTPEEAAAAAAAAAAAGETLAVGAPEQQEGAPPA